MLNIIIIAGIVLGGMSLSAAKRKPLPVGSCIADKLLCNANDPNLDPWQVECYNGALLRIEAVGKHSYKTGCVEETFHCKGFVSFRDARDFFFPIECPPKVMRLRNSVPLPKE
jgi:hypothetical protein